MANVALLIAGGSGNRMGQSIPKQFLTVNERPVIVYTLEAFQNIRKLMQLQLYAFLGGKQYYKHMQINLISRNLST